MISGIGFRSLGIVAGSVLRSGAGVPVLLSLGIGMNCLYSVSSLATESCPVAAQSLSHAFTADVNFVLRFSINFNICF